MNSHSLLFYQYYELENNKKIKRIHARTRNEIIEMNFLCSYSMEFGNYG